MYLSVTGKRTVNRCCILCRQGNFGFCNVRKSLSSQATQFKANWYFGPKALKCRKQRPTESFKAVALKIKFKQPFGTSKYINKWKNKNKNLYTIFNVYTLYLLKQDPVILKINNCIKKNKPYFVGILQYLWHLFCIMWDATSKDVWNLLQKTREDRMKRRMKFLGKTWYRDKWWERLFFSFRLVQGLQQPIICLHLAQSSPSSHFIHRFFPLISLRAPACQFQP